MNASNLLVELFVEELPPKALQKLGDAFAAVIFEQLKAQGLLASSESRLTAYASPRRLAAHITEVLPQAEDKAVSQKLMPVAVGLDAAGQPTPALLKKLAALGADASAVAGLQRQGEGKAEALFYASTVKGVVLTDGLQKALDDTIAKLPIPKVMRYQLQDGWTSVNFVRPAHGLVALHGTQVLIGVKALGLSAGTATHGHRFEAKVDPVVIRDADSYAEQLREEGAVIASFTERRADIARQLQAAAERIGGGVIPIDDPALLDEVTALVERPNVLVCEFEKEFLAVPQECLILTMKANQKYFPLLDTQGKLTHQFLIVSNITPQDASAVIGGNERVVRPRLADAKFFFDQDRKKTLESRLPQLAKVVYHNQLGTQGERTERVRAIAREVGRHLGGDALAQSADTAARLAKADLLTDMVGEFPELQGVMGGYYARHDGLSEDIALAIEDHYKPRFAGDALPRGDVGTVVALADKLETLVGLFGIGALPTGDRDPFALRRHALGVIRMLLEKQLPIDLLGMVHAARQIHDDSALRVLHVLDTISQGTGAQAQMQRQMAPDTEDAVMGFFFDRLAVMLKDSGHSPQAVDAVLSLKPTLLRDVPTRLDAVRAFTALPEAPALAAANKRIGNILKKSEGDAGAALNPTLLHESAEQALHAAMQAVLPQADAQFAAGDYTASLQTLAALRAPVDAFFDGVMVNADDAALKANRLALLHQLHQAMNRVADLSRLAA